MVSHLHFTEERQMNARKFIFCTFLFFIFFLALPLHANAEKLIIYTVNYPLAYFTERIGGEHVKVVFPVPPDMDPAFWKPDMRRSGSFRRLT